MKNNADFKHKINVNVYRDSKLMYKAYIKYTRNVNKQYILKALINV